MIILFMLLSIFVSGMNLAIDTSAGERERNSLALLLSHPISLQQLIASKVCAVSAFRHVRAGIGANNVKTYLSHGAMARTWV